MVSVVHQAHSRPLPPNPRLVPVSAGRLGRGTRPNTLLSAFWFPLGAPTFPLCAAHRGGSLPRIAHARQGSPSGLIAMQRREFPCDDIGRHLDNEHIAEQHAEQHNRFQSSLQLPAPSPQSLAPRNKDSLWKRAGNVLGFGRQRAPQANFDK